MRQKDDEKGQTVEKSLVENTARIADTSPALEFETMARVHAFSVSLCVGAIFPRLFPLDANVRWWNARGQNVFHHRDFESNPILISSPSILPLFFLLPPPFSKSFPFLFSFSRLVANFTSCFESSLRIFFVDAQPFSPPRNSLSRALPFSTRGNLTNHLPLSF